MVNSQEALRHRRDAGALQWRGPLAMLFARIAIAVGAQVMLAALFFLHRSPTAWSDTEPWLIFDADYMALRLLSSLPHSLFKTVLYLRVRRIFPLAIAHALLDGASVLLPSLQA